MRVIVKIEKVFVIARLLPRLSDAFWNKSVGFPFTSVAKLKSTFHDPVVAFAGVPMIPLLVHVVIVHPEVVQLVPFHARSQSPGLATQPGFALMLPPTTAFVAKAELLEVMRSPEFEMVPVKVTLLPLAASVGVTGMRNISFPRGEIFVVLVQVTPVPTWAPHDHPLSVKLPLGPVILVGIVSLT
jgi:hypothetical protein